jgi:ubiquinone/menaquinone biosynthesis C-methylase UbiE
MKISWNALEQQWRKQLFADAVGNVLELEVGAGNNFKYYPAGVSVTATDMSARLIEKAKTEAAACGVRTGFIVSPVEELELQRQSFDTIISTFTLSAYQNPVEVLQRFNHWCRADGKILLMDYGLSQCGIVSWLQQKWGPYHYKRTGSHIDKDLLAILSASRLKIKRIEVKYAGMVYLVWASLHPANGINNKN